MASLDSHKQARLESQEFVIRAPGALHQGVEYSLGKFPTAFSEFQLKKKGWHIQPQAEANDHRRRGAELQPKRDRVLPLALEDRPGHSTHLGQPEGGITGTGVGMTYFVLQREGPHFTALPVKDWYNFRPTVRSQAMSLEEAEKQMNTRGSSVRMTAGSKLGALAAKAEAEGDEVGDGDGDGERPDSDEEREQTRAARIRAANVEAEKGAAADGGEDMPSTKVHTDQQEKGEDWEHEEERADDDLEQGDDEASDQETPAGKKAGRLAAVDGDSDAEGAAPELTEEQQELRRVLRKTRLSSGSEDGDAPSSGAGGPASDDEDDDDDDDVDLDEMASGLLPAKQAKGSREPSPAAKGKKTALSRPPANRAREKRKASTPPTKPDGKKAKPAADPAAIAAPGSSTQSEASSGPPGPAEILQALRAWGPVTTGELTSRFRRRLASQQDKQAFMASVKRVSKLEERPPGSGKKFVVPK